MLTDCDCDNELEMMLCFGWLSEYKSKVCSDQNSGQSVWSVLNQVEAGLLVCVC